MDISVCKNPHELHLHRIYLNVLAENKCARMFNKQCENCVKIMPKVFTFRHNLYKIKIRKGEFTL